MPPTPLSMGAILAAQLPPCHSPHQLPALPHSSGENKGAVLHLRISPAPVTVPVQGTVQKPRCEAETGGWRSLIPSWGSWQQVA